MQVTSSPYLSLTVTSPSFHLLFLLSPPPPTCSSSSLSLSFSSTLFIHIPFISSVYRLFTIMSSVSYSTFLALSLHSFFHVFSIYFYLYSFSSRLLLLFFLFTHFYFPSTVPPSFLPAVYLSTPYFLPVLTPCLPAFISSHISPQFLHFVSHIHCYSQFYL